MYQENFVALTERTPDALYETCAKFEQLLCRKGLGGDWKSRKYGGCGLREISALTPACLVKALVFTNFSFLRSPVSKEQLV
jgi:hypothetical protein